MGSGLARVLVPVALLLCLGFPARAADVPPECPAAEARTAPLHADAVAQFEKLRERDAAAALAYACAALRQLARQTPAAAYWRLLTGTALFTLQNIDAAEREIDAADAELRAQAGDQRALLAQTAFWKGACKGRSGHYVDAGPHYVRAGQLLAEIDANTAFRARVLIALATVQRATRDVEGAQRSLAEAEARLQALGLAVSREASEIHNTRSLLAYERQDMAAARDHAYKEIAVMLVISGPEDAELLYPYSVLGTALTDLQEYAEAEEVLRKAVALGEVAGDREPAGYVLVLGNLAGLLTERGRPAEGLRFAKRALVAAEAHFGADGLRVLPTLMEIGAALEYLGDYPAAERSFVRALAVADRHAANIGATWRTRLLFHLATTYFRLGDNAAAQTYVDLGAGIADADGKLRFQRGRFAHYAGLIAARKAAWPDAERQLSLAQENYRQMLAADHPLLLDIASERCTAQVFSGIPAEACGEVERRLAADREMSPRIRQAALLSLARKAERAGDHEGALQLRVAALAVAETLGTPDPLWIALDQLATSLYRRGEVTLAIFFGKQAVGQIEALRGHFVGETVQREAGFLADKLAVYRRVADWLTLAGRVPEALEVMRLLKSQELYDFFERDAQAGALESGAELSKREAALEDEWERLRGEQAALGREIERLTRLADSNRITAVERERLASLTRTSELLHAPLVEAIGGFIASHAGAVSKLPRATPVHLARVSEDTAIAYLFMGEAGVNIVVTTRRGTTVERSDMDPARLALTIGSYLEAMAERRDLGAPASKLYEEIGRPVDQAASRAGARRLKLWLDGPLRYLPFAALHDGKRYMAEKYAIEHILPAPLQRKVTNVERGAGIRALGVTRAMNGLPGLPAIGDELCGIVRGPVIGLAGEAASCAGSGQGNGPFRGEGYANAYFTEERMRELLTTDQSFGLLHIGTHFSLRPGNIGRSWLLLGDGERLSLDSMREFDFGGLRLVTLSACQTGMAGGQGDDGREIEGLPALMHRQGAGAVVSSLWRVDDQSAARLMKAFYAGMRERGNSLAEALRQASVQFINQPGKNQKLAHPYYWTPFILSTVQQIPAAP